ncbi:MAG TPA: hypothetical protein VJB57_05815 [Dehalococcoidia bacterium]|nr:hypothetical protein [Dehalococcoidia bacterium]
MPQPPSPSPHALAPGRRGGRRPGAGAPRGNVNALKRGLDSPRFLMAARIINVVPDLRYFFKLIGNAPTDRQKLRLLKLLTGTLDQGLNNYRIIDSIKSLLIKQLYPDGCQTPECPLDLFDARNQSNPDQSNQFVPFLDAYRAAHPVEHVELKSLEAYYCRACLTTLLLPLLQPADQTPRRRGRPRRADSPSPPQAEGAGG